MHQARASVHMRVRQHGVITTMAIRREREVKALLDVPDGFAVAAVIALGYPARQVTKLRREPVAAFATVDSFNGPAFYDREPEG